MTRAPVSIVIPALGPSAELERALASLAPELERRGAVDEVIVVDDSGSGELAGWLSERMPTARCVARRENGGFARALASGIDAARHPLVLAMNSDLAARTGFLAPLVAALGDEQVFAAVPRVLLGGDGARVESFVRLPLEEGRLRLSQPCLEEPPAPAPERDLAVPFAVGGACLMRKRDFVELGGFDPLFEPFYLEDADLGWRAWRGGRRIVLCARSEVEHAGRATIGRLVPERIVRAAIEKNLWLFQWKHLAGEREIAAHLAALEREVLAAWVEEDRERLVWLALALDELERVLAARRALPAARASFAELSASSDPFTEPPG